MSSMSQKAARENIRSWRAICILAVPMAAVTAMRLHVCGQQMKSGMPLPGQDQRL